MLSFVKIWIVNDAEKLYQQHLGRYVPRPSSGVCWTPGPTRNFELYLIHGITCSDCVNHKRVKVLSIPVLLLICSQDWTCHLQMTVSLEA